jgi:hypothetical protein
MSYAQEIVRRLGGEWFPAHGYGLAPGPGHSKKDRSLKIAPHATDEDDVFIFSFAGDDVLDLKKAWREAGLLPQKAKSNQPRDPVKVAVQQKRAAEEALRTQDTASLLWRKSLPADEIVKTYFRSRKLVLELWPQTIRYLPACPPKYLYPAMIVPFGLPDEPQPGVFHMPADRVHGVHLTYLMADGSGKAPAVPQRKMFGKIKGLPLSLVPPSDALSLLIGEGIETALSGAMATGLGAWAAGAATFLPALADAVPNFIESVAIAREDDPAGKRGADELERRLKARGIEVIVLEAARRLKI